MAEARRLLQHHFGYPEFRPAQAAVIASILAGHDTLAILPTGGGKSICFQIPALVLGGLTIVVSPLISLMQDQVSACQARGIAAACLHSHLGKEDERALRAALADRSLRLLYVSPERLERVSLELAAGLIRPLLLVVDEAHCIAEWGHDFRPSYRKLARMRYRLGNPQAVALTGSATLSVRQEIVRTLRLRTGYALHLGSFDRSNLWFGARLVQSERERLAALRALLRGDDVMALVYAPTRGTTEAIARTLVEAGHRAAPYHAGLSKARRMATLEDFLGDRLDVIVATCAFGMGIDKPNVRLVVHWTPPPTPEAYYQEAGRAGRDGEFARCVLLWRPGDATLHRRQLDVTFPPRELLERIWSGPRGQVGVPANVLESAERLRRELRPERGPVDWRPVLLRRREAEFRIQAVERYAGAAGCRRAGLVGYFGERLLHCAGCDRCGTKPPPSILSPEIAERLSRLRRVLASRRSAWGGCPLEPDVLLRLARCPPPDASALADVAGVGPAVASRLGAVILGAVAATATQPQRPTETLPLLISLQKWRTGVAKEMGVPAYVVLTDIVLGAIAEREPQTRDDLARVPGIGPRALAKFSDALLDLTRRAAADLTLARRCGRVGERPPTG